MGEEAVVPLQAYLFEETCVADASEKRAAFAGFPDAPHRADKHVVLPGKVLCHAAVHELQKHCQYRPWEISGMGIKAHL